MAKINNNELDRSDMGA